MKFQCAALALLASAVSAHYTFPYLQYNGKTTGEWAYVRETTNHYSNGPVQNVESEAMRCYQLKSGNEGAKTMAVKAGKKIGFKLDTAIIHPGPVQIYMAKAPSGDTAANFNGAGEKWFKIYEEHPTFSDSTMNWASTNKQEVSATIPECLEDGYYLVRVEHIAIHSASTKGGAQFYLACGQVHVSGGGSTTPTDLVAFPGAYKATDPGILINIYYPVPTSYKNPGPDVFKCSS